MRRAELTRRTKETWVSVELELDGKGKTEVSTGVRFLNHMLESMTRHAGFDLKLKAEGDLKHHVVEDVFICLGQALLQALGEKRDIWRFGEATVPMDDALVLVSVDLSGRSYFQSNAKFTKRKLEDLEADLIEHGLRSFASFGRFNLHVLVLRKGEDHHQAEAIFKALGLALCRASTRRPGVGIPSTKESL